MIVVTKERKRLIKEIQKIDPDFTDITEEEYEACLKEDPSFRFSEKDLREILAMKQVWPMLEETIAMFNEKERLRAAGVDIDSGVEGNILATPAD